MTWNKYKQTLEVKVKHFSRLLHVIENTIKKKNTWFLKHTTLVKSAQILLILMPKNTCLAEQDITISKKQKIEIFFIFYFTQIFTFVHIL